MAHFLVDEDLPRSLVRALREAGLEADHVIDSGLRGEPDDAIVDHAMTNGMTLVSADLGFANVLRFPLGAHDGIVVTRFSNEMSTMTTNAAIVRALGELSDEELRGNLIILEPGRVRLRRGR
jgi:predicted nuclease of predicted toxin-antitoxin system